MLMARWCGMRVDRFSVGFGPSLLRWKGKETTYQVALIPLGGFVQIAGMNPHENLPPEDPGSYVNKSAGARFATIFAGPLTNYLFAILIMVGIMAIMGMPQWRQVIAEVVPGSPAERGGMKAGDIIEAISGQWVSNIPEVMDRIAKSQGRTLDFRVRRTSGLQQLKIIPKRDGGVYRIGIQFGRKLSFTPLAIHQALISGVLYPINESRTVLSSLGQLISGRASVKQLGGPLEIVRQLKLSFEESLGMAFLFMAMLSVYLGLFNLLPIPALDGGRLVFLLYTMISGRQVNQRIESAIHAVGFILLMGLILLVTYRDIARFLGFQ